MRKGIETATLGDLIDWLKPQKPDNTIRFDFCRMYPAKINSWRGRYDELALGFSVEEPCTAGELLGRCEEAVGKVYEGYKGGAYRMTRDTQVWVDNWGEYTSTIIVDLKADEYEGVIITQYQP